VVAALVVALLVLARLLVAVSAILTVVLPTVARTVATVAITSAIFLSWFIAASLLVRAIALPQPLIGLLGGTAVLADLIIATLRRAGVLAKLSAVADLGLSSPVARRGVRGLSRRHQLRLRSLITPVYLLALAVGLARRMLQLTHHTRDIPVTAGSGLALLAVAVFFPGAS